MLLLLILVYVIFLHSLLYNELKHVRVAAFVYQFCDVDLSASGPRCGMGTNLL